MLGTTVPNSTGETALHGKTLSLNLKMCKHLEPPSRDRSLVFTVETPTRTIPGPGHISKRDLEGLYRALKTGHLIVGPNPIPEFDKVPEVLDAHIQFVKSPFPLQSLKDYVVKEIVNGPSLQGGYTKLEVLSILIEEEQKGRNRPPLVEFLKEALEYCEQTFGGVSRVKKEEFVQELSSSGKEYVKAAINSQKAKNILGL